MSFQSIFRNLRAFFNPQRLVRRSVETHYALAEACLIGLVSALAAVLLKQGIGWLGTSRIQMAQHYGAFVALPITGVTLGFVAGWVIEIFSPAASGGGIPQVKAVLAQFPISLSLRVAIAKTIGTILILGSGFTLGRRGPTVHIGAALAAQLSSWVPTSPEHRRQMIAAGAAAGLAAGFNTPIAGVMFVIEELMRDVSDLTLETAILASFTGAVVSRLLGSADLNLVVTDSQGNLSAAEIPFYLLLGLLAGLLGALFNKGILFSLKFNRRLNLAMPWRIAISGLISGLVLAGLPEFFRNHAGLRESLMMGGNLGWETIAIAFAAHFTLTLLAYGSGAPGGLFSPALILGSALGYLVSSIAIFSLGEASQYTYALTGMGAFFTAVVRVPITAIVIIFEITADFNLVLPLMIGCAVAYIVGETAFPGSIYQHLLKNSGIQLEESHGDQFLAGITAAEVMQREVETLPLDLNLEQALQIFSRSSHHGFPVLENGELVGLVTQTELASLGQKSGQLILKDVMIPRPVTVNPQATLSSVLYLLNRYQLSHLPVIEGHKLLGIITRSDVIRVEADQLSGEANQVGFKPQPSYAVYQTRAPVVGRGRILLPLANPETAPDLLKIATAITRHRQYELECLQVIQIPRHQAPDQTPVTTTKQRRLFRQAEQLAKRWQIPLHTQIRVAHDTAQAILDTVRDRHIDLLIMGWKGTTVTPGQIFGYVTDSIIRQAPCDVILIKQGSQAHSYPRNKGKETSWLIPIAGGPNTQRALQLLPCLTTLAPNSQIWLCQVFPPTETDTGYEALASTAYALKKQFSCSVLPIPIRSYSISEAVISLAKAENCNVVVLGATREGLLQQAIHGNIPQTIAQGVDSTVILVRGAL